MPELVPELVLELRRGDGSFFILGLEAGLELGRGDGSFFILGLDSGLSFGAGLSLGAGLRLEDKLAVNTGEAGRAIPAATLLSGLREGDGEGNLR